MRGEMTHSGTLKNVRSERTHTHKSNISGIELHAQELSLLYPAVKEESVIVVDEVVLLFILVSKHKNFYW